MENSVVCGSISNLIFVQLKKNPNRPTKSLNTYSDGTNIQLFKIGRLAECVEQWQFYWINSQQPTHAPDVCLCPIILLSLHHLWRRVHVRTTICVEKFRFIYVSSKTKICQKRDNLYHCMTIIRYHNRYPYISKNKKTYKCTCIHRY